MKEQILGVIEDGVLNLLVYDRKGDEDLPIGTIEETIASGEISVDDIVEKFRTELIKRINERKRK